MVAGADIQRVWKRKVTAEYVPTDAQRSLVESASAFGITQAEIATQLKISEPTLRKQAGSSDQ
jgi:hypothetical protein